jgi:hypothetical protein
VGEVSVRVYRLALGGWSGQGGVAGAEGPFGAGAQVRCCYLGGEGVEEDGAGEVLGGGRGVLLDWGE